MANEVQPFFSLPKKEVLNLLKTTESGLTNERANSVRLKYGYNVIPEKKQTPRIIIFLRQFRSLMVYILLFAGAISFLLDKLIDAYVISAIILINAVIGYFQESKAEEAIKALKKMVVQKAKVYRSGQLVQIPAKKLVPGDIILLEEGDKIPADARLIEINDFRTVESSLTGESLPIDKNLKLLPESIPVSDRKNMVFLGTFVASGTAKAVVTETGASTAIGKLAKTIESIPDKRSHFQEKMDALSKYMAIIAVLGSTTIFVIGYFVRNLGLADIFLFTLASLVSGIPEGLPAILATVLAIGSYRMAKRNAIVRNKYATETLNVVDTIITDKTGTLTQNTMTVQEIILPGQKSIKVTGEGWEPTGDFYQNEKKIVPLENHHLARALHIAAYCNDASIYKEGKRKYKIIGDPTEASLVVVGQKAGVEKSALLSKEKRIDEIPFNPQLKYRASLSVLSEKGGEKQMYIVGAPEEVLSHSRFILKNSRKTTPTKKDKDEITKHINNLTNKAMRVVGVGYKEVSSNKREVHNEDVSDIIFVGIFAMIDPPRPEVSDAVKRAKDAGIRVIMATGDHGNTALAIAKDIGLIDKNSKNDVLTGAELEKLPPKAFEKAVKECSVFARLTPEMKLKIAKALQSQGHVIAMTGDGVNDAPALKQADVGISMGRIGTDVAREASQMILTDDNFASIISAIEEGRTVFINTRQTSFFLLATGFAEQATIITTMALTLPLSLLPVQILWLNVVTGGTTALALATERPHHDTLAQKPKKRNEEILTKEVLPYLILVTGIMIILTILAFNYFLNVSGPNKARTAAFAVLSLTQVFNMLNMRSLKNTIFTLGIFSNKYVIYSFIVSVALMLAAMYIPLLQGVFSLTALSIIELASLFVISSLVFWAGEGYKYVKQKE